MTRYLNVAAPLIVALLEVCSTPLLAEVVGSDPVPPPINCLDSQHTLLLQKGNVILRNVRWKVPATGEYGCGYAVIPRLTGDSGDTGHIWFFNPNNIELTCKALDGETINDHYWVFCGALTNVEWWMDAVSNANPIDHKTYYNPPSRMASFGDVSALSSGGNGAPQFDNLNCGGTFGVGAGGIGSISAFVQDPEADSLSVSASVIEGEDLIEFEPQWTNPLPGTGAHVLTAMKFLKAGRSALMLEAADGKHLVPSRCIFTFLVVAPGSN